MFLCINMELVNEQPTRKCLTLSYIFDKEVALPTKGLIQRFNLSFLQPSPDVKKNPYEGNLFPVQHLEYQEEVQLPNEFSVYLRLSPKISTGFILISVTNVPSNFFMDCMELTTLQTSSDLDYTRIINILIEIHWLFCVKFRQRVL